MGKPSVLIVDDEPVNLQKAAECLKGSFELHFARNGQDAIDYLREKTTGLILLDINMPGMNGFEVAKELKKFPSAAHTPIIYLTGDNSEATIAMAFNSGAVDYITKPFRQEELVVRVKNRIETETLKADLHKSFNRNRHLLQIINTHVAYLKTDPEGIITEVSESFCEMFKNRCDGIVGENVNILKSGYTNPELYRLLWDTVSSGQTFSCELENRNYDGETHWFRVTITPDVDESGNVIEYVAFYHNVDDKVKFEHNAYTDFLTGLGNRSKLEKSLNEEILRVQRYGLALSIILADIDHFKKINDGYGHDAGDSVLQEFSELLAKNIRQTDFAARWGGEEFVILCPGTDAEGGRVLAESLRQRIQEFTFSQIGNITASFGVVEYRVGMNEKELFSRVDQALYDAKAQGRNKVIVSSF